MKRVNLITPALVLFILAFVFSISSDANANSYISAEEVIQLQLSNPELLIIDVRMIQAFNIKHVEGAINIPVFSIGKKKLPAGNIIIYDGGIGTVEAKDAFEKLSLAGMTKVFILDGGIARWEAMGFPMFVQPGILGTSLSEPISAAELSRAIGDRLDLIIADLRIPEEFQDSTIVGAVNIPPDDLLTVSGEWSKDSIIILIDSGDDVALKQAERLRRVGFKLVRFLHGGFPEWLLQNAQ